jgi:hypothetical protein
MALQQNSKDTYIQLSKPYFTIKEIDYLQKSNSDLYQNIRSFKAKTQQTFQIIINLAVKLNLPIRILQNTNYFYQRFYLLTNNYKKYSNLHFEVGLASLFISLKLNDYIKKVSVVITEAYNLKGMYLSNSDVEENKKIIISLERKILEFQSFDFRNFLIEEFFIKFLKNLNEEKEGGNRLLPYIGWSCLNDLYLTPLVLQYPAHYNAIIALSCSNLIFNELVKEKIGPEPHDEVHWNTQKILNNIKNYSFINAGSNQLLEYFIDNLSKTFFRNSLNELNLEVDDKKLVDLLLNIKININSSVISQSLNNPTMLEDLFFKQRDTEIAKTGSLRFLYNKQKYTDEIKLYKST